MSGCRKWETVFLFSPLLLTHCSWVKPVAPSIEFTKLPAFAAGSSVLLNSIEGRVTGAHAGDKVVVYAKSGFWWIQPLVSAPFATIRADSTWHTQTHPGFAYAALLVKDGFRPRGKTDVLPEKGGGVLALATVRSPNVAQAAGKTLLFAGYEWRIRETASEPGGTINEYDPQNAWQDKNGALHLRITGSPGHWKSAEVNLTRSLGYGSYRFAIRDLSQLEPAAVFTMLTWDDDGPFHEMDIEVSRWGEPDPKNGQFVIQPYHVAANTVRFRAPSRAATFMLRWAPQKASFRAFQGKVVNWDSRPVSEHVFTTGVPAPGSETIHMNLYVFGSERNPLRHGAEVIVDEFEYLP